VPTRIPFFCVHIAKSILQLLGNMIKSFPKKEWLLIFWLTQLIATTGTAPILEPLLHEHEAIYRSSILSAEGDLLRGPEDIEISSTYDLFSHGLSASRSHPRGFGFLGHDRSKYDWLSYQQMDYHVSLLGNGIENTKLYGPINLDGQSWRMVGIYAEHRIGWTMVELAAARQNITLVPLYDTSNPEFVLSILRQTQLQTVFASFGNAVKLFEIVRDNRNTIDVHQVALIGSEEERLELLQKFPGHRLPIILMKEIKAAGTVEPVRSVSPNDVNTICFTSGTTGEPKGVLVTHRMLAAVVASAVKLGLGLSNRDVYFAFLPPAHIFERVLDLTIMFIGARIGYYSGDKKALSRDISKVKPTLMAGVPRSLEKTLERINSRLKLGGKIKQALIASALHASDSAMNRGGNQPLSLINSFIIRKIRSALGGRLRLILSGGGPLHPSTQARLKQVLHVYVIQGYGLTETTGGTLIQHPWSTTYGVVGSPFPCVEIKLANQELYGDIEEGAGEIWVRGPSVFAGYFRSPKLSAEVITHDGWFKTGDVGVVVPDENGNDQFKIVGRSKDIFKLPNGEYVVPVLLENFYKLSEAVEEIFIDLSPSGESLVALVNVRRAFHDQVMNTDASGRTECSESVLSSEQLGLKRAVMESLTSLADQFKLNHSERITEVVITKVHFGPDSEFQTVTMKPKRVVLRKLLLSEYRKR
jgi:long-chain acyl-CoA synthetase